MEQMSTFEMIMLGVIALGVLLWAGPGVKTMLQQSREAEKDWAGVLFPIALVILFVIFLIMMV